jgi:hypothetical protein
MLSANPLFKNKYPIIDNISLDYNLVEHMLPNFVFITKADFEK